MKPKEKKILMYGGGAAILIGGYLYFTKNDNSGGSDDPTGNGDISSPGNISDNFNAKKIANELYEIMSYTVPNKTGILNALRSVTQDQFAEVIKAFGKNKYNSTFGNTLEAFYQTLPAKDLIYWLQKELGNEIQTLKLKYPKYL